MSNTQKVEGRSEFGNVILRKGRDNLEYALAIANEVGEYQKARFIQNALDQVDALLHLERIRKK